jgi:hypothetical protein
MVNGRNHAEIRRIGVVVAGKLYMSADADSLAYAYRPSLLGAPTEFRLTGDAIDWRSGSGSGHIPLRDVRLVRMSFKPATMQPYRFVTELWAEGAPRLEIVSSSWKNMVEQERLDARYAAFVTELHRRLALAAAPARFVQGKHPMLFWPGLAFFVLMALVMAATVSRALQTHNIGVAAFIAALMALFLWQGGNFFRRNKPGTYRPEALPPELMPKG